MRVADIFSRCVHFLNEQRIASPEELDVAMRVLFDVSPVDNAGPYFELDGRRFIQFSSNDYLGLSVHPAVRRAAAEAAMTHGIGNPMGARPLTGTCELHLELERRIAEFKRTEAALTFATGANAMTGMVGCLAKPGDLIILDQFAHASLIAGAKISGAQMRTFRHNDPASLERILTRADPRQAKLIVIDGVYSMNGDIAPIPEICDLKDKFGARLIVDDAHGHGVCGQHGRGAAEVLKCEDRIDLHAGTFSKAFGTSGGFIAGDKAVVAYIRYLAPTLLFTKAANAVVTTATLKALELLEQAEDRRARLWSNARLFQARLRQAGFDIGQTQTPITPISLGGNTALFIADILRRDFGIYAAPVLYPAVRRNQGILRTIPTAMHEPSDLHYFVDSLEEAFNHYTRRQAAGVLSTGT
ncbi:MAG: aminotransferase class I/II-fold pyridoxal phosphate-dependent enzyme [Phycisphaeraceae bacterium]|nr:aminotransferase class I/II-fold pyridoxal phosphate-dependent enzyme [Phycisphaeraceae bacterium]